MILRILTFYDAIEIGLLFDRFSPGDASTARRYGSAVDAVPERSDPALCQTKNNGRNRESVTPKSSRFRRLCTVLLVALTFPIVVHKPGETGGIEYRLALRLPNTRKRVTP